MNFGITEDNDITREELSEQTTMRYLNKAPILHISKIRDDSEFEGIVYCTKSHVSKDLFDDRKWSGTFHLIDGEGIKFTAVFYGMDVRFEEHCGPAYVKGVKRYKSNNGGREYTEFRLTEIQQSTVDCPKSIFLKELPDYNKVRDTFRSNLSNLMPSAGVQVFLNDLNALKLQETLEQETFADTYGTFIGARMEAFNKACSMMYTLAKPNTQLELCYLGFLLKLWRPEVAISSITVDAELSDNLLVLEMIYKSNLTKLEKIKLVDCVQNKGQSIEGRLVNDVYRTIANYLRSLDQLRFKSTGELGLFM